MLSMLLMDASGLMIPLSIGIAMLRSRLFDIDVVINRTLVYGSLTLMLVLVYFGGVTATQALFSALTRTGEAATARRGRLDARDRRAVQPPQTAHPGVHRQALLQAQVRREKDAGSLHRQAAGRDGSGRPGRRSGRGGQGDDAAGTRLAVVTSTRRSRPGHERTGRMRRRAVTWLAWSLVGVPAVLLLCGISLLWLRTLSVKGFRTTARHYFVSAAINLVTLLPFSVIGALIVSRQPRNAIGWIYCGVGLLVGLDDPGAWLRRILARERFRHKKPRPRRRRGLARGHGFPWSWFLRACCCCCSRTDGCFLPAGGPWPGARELESLVTP